jgi:hypothetical protein
MPTNEYRRHAAACLCIADETANPDHKMLLIAMAQAWLTLARRAEDDLAADTFYEPPPPPAKAAVFVQRLKAAFGSASTHR